MKSGPRLPQLEKALAQKRRPNIAINQSINQSIFKKKKEVLGCTEVTAKFYEVTPLAGPGPSAH